MGDDGVAVWLLSANHSLDSVADLLTQGAPCIDLAHQVQLLSHSASTPTATHSLTL